MGFMRSLVIKLMVFVAVVEKLGHVNFMVLVSGLALVIVGLVCADMLVTNLSSRAQ